MTEIPKLIRQYHLPFDRFEFAYTEKQKEKLNIAFDDLMTDDLSEPISFELVKFEMVYLYHWSKEAYYFAINTKEFKEAVRLDFVHKKLETYLKNIKELDKEYANKIASENIEEKKIFGEPLIGTVTVRMESCKEMNEDEYYMEKYKDASSYDW